jgi:RNA polymerase sigma-70 factor (ECF subfamily)
VDTESADQTGDPDRVLQEAEASRAVHEALQALSDIHRTVIVLKHLQGLTYQEISEVLDIPETTVKSRLFDARRRLRTVLHDQGWL